MVTKAQTPAEALAGLVEGVMAKWAKQRKAEERDASARQRRDDRMVYHRVHPVSLKSAACRVMRQAYMAASANGTLPANPRQIMHAARPQILQIADKDDLDSQYFCQTLLPDYIREHDECADWDIAWDDRGHFVEPHTGKAFGVGTLNVRDYVARYASPALKEPGFAPAGVLIDKDIERKLRGHLGSDANITFHRIGINADQLAEYGLPTKPRKLGDRCAAHIADTLEAEALPAKILLRLLREKVESFLAPGALAVVRKRSQSALSADIDSDDHDMASPISILRPRSHKARCFDSSASFGELIEVADMPVLRDGPKDRPAVKVAGDARR